MGKEYSFDPAPVIACPDNPLERPRPAVEEQGFSLSLNQVAGGTFFRQRRQGTGAEDSQFQAISSCQTLIIHP